MDEFKYPTFSDSFHHSSLQLRDQPVFRSLGVVQENDDCVQPLSSLKVVDIPIPSFDWGRPLTTTTKKVGLDFEVNRPSGDHPRPLRDVPCYVEKHTSFPSSLPPQRIFDSLVQALTKLRIDFEYQHLKNTIKGVCYPNNIPCSFRVNVFRSTNNLLVEFQRRSGCVVQFSKFYADVLSAMNTSETQPISTASSASVPESLEHGDLDQATMRNLVRMASSELVDVQREGLRVLTNFVSSESNKKLLLAASPNFISSILSSADDEVVRLGSVLASHLSSFTSQTTVPIAVSVFSVLSSSASATTLIARDTKRHLSQAAAGYSKMHQKYLRSSPRISEYVNCLERYSCSADVETRKAVSVALDQLVF